MTSILKRKKNEYRFFANKGFTMVELIVVLVLFSIIASISIFGALGWIDWVNFQHENSTAEDIFYAAQNQLTELDASNALQRKVIDVLWDTNDYNSDYVIGQGTNKNDVSIFNSLRDSNGSPYSWNAIWRDNVVNLKKDKKTIISLVAPAGSYDTYLASSDSVDTDVRLLFDLVAPYVTDKSVLNGCIALEFSPEAAQVFAVCYSDKMTSFTYVTGASGSIVDRTLQKRRETMLGYYGVDTLTSKIKGRDFDSDGYRLEIENDEVLSLILGSNSEGAVNFTGATIGFDVQGAFDYDSTSYETIMTFSLSSDDVGKIYKDGGITSLEDAVKDPIPVQVALARGVYSNNTFEFKLPIWKDGYGALHVVLDAADIQAQSITYAETLGILTTSDSEDLNSDVRKAFRNTFSFYRFGIPDIRFIRASASVSMGGTPSVTEAGRKPGNPADFVKYSDDAGKIHGEAVTFANPETGDDSNTYGIENGRHLYNVRFESDYSDAMKVNNLIADSVTRVFTLKNNIDWKKDFLGGDGDTNYLFNSYGLGSNPEDSGINICADSTIPELSYMEGDTVKNPVMNTQYYPFPGFRILSYGDKFTQAVDLQAVATGETSAGNMKYYKISGLDISLAANCAYGVYGKDAMEKFIAESPATGSEKYNDLITLGKEGYMPLGLFAESYGEISNIELDDIEVRGVEGYPLNNPTSFFFTCKVGGFVGENFGTLKNLLIDVSVTEPTSYIRGRSDVGGIVGHQYYLAKDKDKNTAEASTPEEPYKDAACTLAYCANNAKVTGIGYVGGIIGRIYPSGGDAGGNTATGKNVYDLQFKINGTPTYYSDLYIAPVASDATRLAFKTVPIKKFTIDNCVNRGEISMDPYFAERDLDNNTFRRGYYFGGITGAAFNNFNETSNSQVNTYAHNTTGTRVAVISNCTSYTLYTESELDDILKPESANSNSSEKIQDTKRRLKACFVGGIVGGIRYGYIDNCSNSPKYEDASAGKYSFVFGDRYVGGIAGYSMETNYSGGTEYTQKELARITGSSSPEGYGTDYSVINATGTYGNYAVGGVAGAFGRPECESIHTPPFKDCVAERLEKLYGSYEDENGVVNGDRKFPANCSQINKTNNQITGLLNTAIVLGGSFNSTVNAENTQNDTHLGNGIYYGVGGIAGLLATPIRSADNIQTEDNKLLYIKYIFGEGSKASSVSSKLDGLSANDVHNKVNSSAFATDGVGGIVGLALETGDINVADGNTKFHSLIDAVVFGRNRVGGGVGDNTACRGSKNRMANLKPYKKTTASSGLYVMGEDCVGGVIGVFGDSTDDDSDGSLNRKADFEDVTIDCGFRVTGYRAVGGYIGEYCNKCRSIMSYFKVNGFDNKIKTVIKGSMYVGGLVGLQEGAPEGGNSSDPDSYNKYYAYLRYVDVKSDCFGGCVIGAMFKKGQYWPVDRLLYYPLNKINDSARTNPINQIYLTTDMAGGCITGVYAVNKGNTVINCVNSTEWNNVNNYRPAGDGSSSAPFKSVNGIYNNEELRDLTYTLTSTSTEANYISYINTLKDDDYFGGVSNNRVTMDLFDMSELIQAGGDDNLCHVTSKIYTGGLFGFTGDVVNVTVNSYRNRARLWATGGIQSKEAGEGDTAKYAYLGAVIGKIPKGMILNYCRNTSCRNDTNNKNNNYNSPKATYVGLMAEVNEGKVYNSGYRKKDNHIYSIDAPDYSAKVTTNNNNTQYFGGVVGLNGTKNSDNTNPAIVEGCINVAPIKGKYSSGIVAAVGGTSTIAKCINKGEMNALTYGAGIIGEVASGITSKVVIENNVNYGSFAGSATTKAGIAYNTAGVGEFTACRNYAANAKYAITSTEDGKKAKLIKYCLDASPLTETTNNRSVFGDVTDTANPSANMLANFYVGKNTGMNSLGELIEDADGYFKAETYLSDSLLAPKTTKTSANDILASSISESYVSKDPVDYAYKDNNGNKLTFEITPIVENGSNGNIYANMKSLFIIWDNPSRRDVISYYSQAEQIMGMNETDRNADPDFIAFTEYDTSSSSDNTSYRYLARTACASDLLKSKINDVGTSTKWADTYGLATYLYMKTDSNAPDVSDEANRKVYYTNLLSANIGRYAPIYRAADDSLKLTISSKLHITYTDGSVAVKDASVDIPADVDYKEQDIGFDIAGVSKLELVVDSVTFYRVSGDDKIGVRQLRWKGSSDTDSKPMLKTASTLDITGNAANTLDTYGALSSNKISLSKLYFVNDTSASPELYLYKYAADISNLNITLDGTPPYYSGYVAETTYKQIDNKFKNNLATYYSYEPD